MGKGHISHSRYTIFSISLLSVFIFLSFTILFSDQKIFAGGDTINPTVTTSVSDTLINDALGGTGSFSVTSLYSETMDTGFTPAVSFSADVSGTLTLNVGLSSWTTTTNTDDTYTSVYDVNVASQEVTGVIATTGGGKDLAGNTQDADATASGNTFDVDTINPTVTTSVSDTLINDALGGTGSFSVTSLYSETMDTGFTPAVSFSADVSGTLTLNVGLSSWTTTTNTDDTYTSVYDVNVASQEVTGVIATTGGGKDLAGNTQDADATASGNTFDVDTINPTVTTSVSDTLINDALGGTGSFSVTSLYSETMDTGFTPAVSFSADVSGTLTLNVGLSSWTTTTNTDDTYTSVYDVNVASQEVTGVIATTGGGKDLAGNTQDADATASGNTFDVDTINPTGIVLINAGDPATVLNAVTLGITCTDLGSGCATMEISVDGGTTYGTPILNAVLAPATLPAPRGEKTVVVRFTDVAGNISEDPQASDTIALDAKITIFSVPSNTAPRWGLDSVSFTGTVTNALNSDQLKIDSDNPSTTTSTTVDISNGASGTFSGGIIYPAGSFAGNPHQPAATLVTDLGATVTDASSTPVKVNSPSTVSVVKHNTSVLLNSVDDAYAGNVFSVVGNLIDDELTISENGISGKSIEFIGNGADPPGVVDLSDVTTNGFTVTDSEGILVDTLSSDNVLRLNIGDRIDFPAETSYVILSLSDMGINKISLDVTTGVSSTFQAIGEGQGVNTGIFTIHHSDDISSMVVTGVGPGPDPPLGTDIAGITRVQTLNSEQTPIIDNEFAVPIPRILGNSPISFSEGSFSAIGTSSSTVANDWLVDAQFNDLDPDYLPSADSKTYATLYSTTAGIGGNAAIVADSDAVFTSVLCSVDTDKDALCDDWETTGIPYSGGVFILPDSPSITVPDIYVEIDFMAEQNPFVAGGSVASPNDAIEDVMRAFDLRGIKLHVEQGNVLPSRDLINVWVDADSNSTNDFNSLKSTNFGIGLTAAQKSAKAQAYRYIEFVKSVGGPSGQAESRGNDAVISLGVGFTGTAGSRIEQSGTFMHELGHLLNLNHGGPKYLITDVSQRTIADSSTNCKPIHDSVMSYSRQLNTYLGANWVLDFSDGGLSSTTGHSPDIGLTETTLKETRSGAIGGNLHSANSSAPWIVWGTPATGQTFKKIQASPTGASTIDWNGNGAIASAATNVIKDVNNFGIFGCEASTPTATPYHNYNEWQNLDYNFRQGPSGQFDATYPVLISEEDIVIVGQAEIGTAEEKPVSPWSPNSTIKKKQGSNLTIKVTVRDGAGDLITNIRPDGSPQTAFAQLVKPGTSPDTLVTVGPPLPLTWEPLKSPPHWHVDTKVPPKNGAPGGIYGVLIVFNNPGASPPTELITDSANPQTVNGVIVSLKLTSTT